MPSLVPSKWSSDQHKGWITSWGADHYGASLDAQTRAGKPYQVIRRLHAEFHQSAATVLEDALAGRKDQAGQRLEGEFKERSEKLVRALTKWKGELLSSTSLGT